MSGPFKWLFGGGDLAGAQSWRIGFVADYSNYVVLGLVALFAAMAYLTIRSYRREGDAPRRAKAVLAAIRIAALVLAFVILFRPAVVFRFVNTVYTTLVLLADDSLSMSNADRYADAAQRDALAEYLGTAPADLGKLSRNDILRKALARPGGALARLAENHPLEFMAFSTDSPGKESYTRSVGRIDVAGPDTRGFPTNDLSEILGRLQARGYDTNIPMALRDAMERLRGRRLGGIVLLSDGQLTVQDAGSRLAGATSYAARMGLPLYAVVVGDPTPPRSVAVTALRGPSEVRRGAQVELTAMLAHRNMAGQNVTIRLLRRRAEEPNWTSLNISKTVTLEGSAGPDGKEADRGVQGVDLRFEAADLGEFVYQAVVDPHDGGQSTGGAAEMPLWVSDEKINVLLISSESGMEFQYLKNYLIRQPELYRLSVWQQNADPEINQAASSEKMKLTTLPRKLEDLVRGDAEKGYNVIILCSPQETTEGFDREFTGLLKKFVAEHGGGLCYVAGIKHTDAVVAADETFKPVADLLPVVLASSSINVPERINRPRPEAWPMQLTSYGLEHPLMRLGNAAEETGKIWPILPGIFNSQPVVKVKPAARVLAVNSNPIHRTEKNDPEPLVVVQPVGRGQVMYLGSASTWRWRFVQEGYYHRRFWANAVRFLATLQPRRVIITAGGDRFAAGEPITIEVEAYDEKFEPLKDETFKVDMVNSRTGSVETIVLEKVPNKPGRYTKTMQAAQTGTFELTAMRDDPDAARKVSSKRIVIEVPQAEALRPEADEATMKAIASRAENFLHIQEIDKLPEMIPPGKLATYRDDWREVWDSPLTLLLIVLVLAAEWIIRKKHNMA